MQTSSRSRKKESMETSWKWNLTVARKVNSIAFAITILTTFAFIMIDTKSIAIRIGIANALELHFSMATVEFYLQLVSILFWSLLVCIVFDFWSLFPFFKIIDF